MAAAFKVDAEPELDLDAFLARAVPRVPARSEGQPHGVAGSGAVAQVLGDVANGVVEPSRLRDLTLRLVQGGGIQKKFAELMLPELQDDHDPPLDIDNVTEEIV